MIMEYCHKHDSPRGVNAQCICRDWSYSSLARGPCGNPLLRTYLALPLPRRRHKAFTFRIDSVNGQNETDAAPNITLLVRSHLLVSRKVSQNPQYQMIPNSSAFYAIIQGDMEVSAHCGLHVNYTQALILRAPSSISVFVSY
jgi:hypothetical protein